MAPNFKLLFFPVPSVDVSVFDREAGDEEEEEVDAGVRGGAEVVGEEVPVGEDNGLLGEEGQEVVEGEDWMLENQLTMLSNGRSS